MIATPNTALIHSLLADPEPADLAWSVPQVLSAIDLALKIGLADVAEQSARTLIGRFPDAIAPSILLGRALVEQGRWRQAVEHFRWALAIHPLHAAAWTGLAMALAVGGQTREARAALMRAALNDPLDSELLTPGVVAPPQEGAGISYLRQGHDALAQAELASAVMAHHNRDDLRLYYAEALRRNGDLAGAMAQLEQLSEAAMHLFPTLLLRAALDPTAHTAHRECLPYDLDGQLTRHFFAPLRPPWDVLPAPSVVVDDTLVPLQQYIPAAPTGRKKAGSLDDNHVPRQRVPADVREFIATAERMRVRLVTSAGAEKPLLSYHESGQQVHLMLASRRGLTKTFGMEGATAVERRLVALAETLQQRGIHARICYIDDAESLRLSETIQLNPVAAEPAAIAGLVRTAAQAIATHDQQLGVVLLIGGGACMPFFRMPNPLRDDDPELVSDLPYAGQDENDLAPQMVVARIPDGGSVELLLGQIDRMIARHAAKPRGALALVQRAKPAAQRSAWTLAAGYAAQAWREPARMIIDALHPPADLMLCPPVEATNVDSSQLLGSALFYVNLHGAMGRSNWYGQPEAWGGAASKLPIGLRPDQLTGQCVANGLLLSEACYGMELDRRTSDNSIPLRALHDGMAACIGATVTAYGSYGAPLIGADLLAERIMLQLAAGAPSGVALRQARIEFAQAVYRRQGHLDDVDRKTLLSFVLYGDPWATVAPYSEPLAARLSAFAGKVRLGKPRSAAPVDESQVPREVLAKVRGTLQKVLPGGDHARLAITARTDRSLALKGDGDPDLVFSASESVPTEDGALIHQAAHITISHSAIVKVALTR